MATTPPTKPSATGPNQKVMSASGVFSVEALQPDSTSFPPIYEAAILYAADHSDAAEITLKDYLRTDDGKNSVRAWMMMFDFYQLTNNRQEFDALSMLFSVNFERSAPPWIDAGADYDPRRKEKRERKDLFTFTPTPDGAILEQIDRFEAFAKQMGSARLEFNKVKHILSVEAELFAIVLERTRKQKIPVWFNGLDEFAQQLKQGINEKVGTPPADSQGYWSLLFELYVLDGRLREYEDLGLEYAVAFERSPPPWETVERPAGDESAALLPVLSREEPVVPVGFHLKGVISHNSLEMLQQLSFYASSKSEVAVDMSELLRIDFAAAGLFFESIRTIHLSQKRVVLSNINELVAALLEIFGMTKHAILMRKKSV
ncbi:MAG: STAS domain-containing protein [Aeromicrobium sp.]|nr:STAS domain-containing protein [Burkholderiales bacterium]